jgi:uncharacterized protein with ParB-like and HNH nuclease domain/5-methylcytosine-specific restriction endonuclease McrA
MSNSVFLGEKEFQKIFRDHLRIEAFPKSIENLFGMRMRTKIDYSPYYQRHYVWESSKATYFIESILLGTEIPPLVFFLSNNKIEVIDGRQRYETIERFMLEKLVLVESGLEELKKLARSTFSKLPKEVSDLFLDTKLRIIQFEIIGEPPLDAALEDKIKKEIFRRYNTGITPLRKAELDNAVYDSDELTRFLKEQFEKDPTTATRIQALFLPTPAGAASEFNPQQVLQHIRRMLVMCKYPIKHYAKAAGRNKTLAHLYECFAQHDCDDPASVYAHVQGIVAGIWKLKLLAETKGSRTNRFFWECLFWAMLVLDQEGNRCLETVESLADQLLTLAAENERIYFAESSHFIKVIFDRFSCMAQFFQARTGIDFSVYTAGTPQAVAQLKVDHRAKDTDTEIGRLGELRVNKPDPSKASIDDLLNQMRRRRFLVRPSYQRGEVISQIKASGIIESILLDVALPPIFVFRREDEVSEVVDGQQRLLAILGFIGQPYLDEKNQPSTPKIHRFPLRDLRVLTELSGKRFEELNEAQRGRILDFELFIVEIQEALNPNFDPVDLFVRLNDRPYPIKEHSFEMWNSWADKDCITRIKDNTKNASGWFYLRKRRADDRYRMQNEELYTALAFFEYHVGQQGGPRHPDVFARRDSVAARVANKQALSMLWAKVSQDPTVKQRWLDSINRVEGFLRKLKSVLIDRDVEGNVAAFLSTELDKLVRSPNQRYAVRSSQDFYFLWLMLSPLNSEMVRVHRLQMKAEVRELMQAIKVRWVNATSQPNDSVSSFRASLKQFHDRYRKQERKLRLSEAEKAELIRSQRGTCAISGAPIFVGDDVEVDHVKPLATGGHDSPENLQVSTPEANHRKGPRQSL